MADRPEPRVKSKIRFFASPPPEVSDPEVEFSTIYEARGFAREREGWRVESRRVPI